MKLYCNIFLTFWSGYSYKNNSNCTTIESERFCEIEAYSTLCLYRWFLKLLNYKVMYHYRTFIITFVIILVFDMVSANSNIKFVSDKMGNPPEILRQPQDQTVCSGSVAYFEVIATGDGISFQWMRGSEVLHNNEKISGANSAFLTIDFTDSTDISNEIYVIVSGDYAPNDTSIKVSLNVITVPEFITHPEDNDVCLGNSVIFKAETIGSDNVYQWRRGTENLVNNNKLSGVNTSTLIIDSVTLADIGDNYNLIITNQCVTELSSNNASLKLSNPPIITASPTNSIVCEGGTAYFSVSAIGDSLSFQWRKGETILFDQGNISGTNTPVLTIDPVHTTDIADNYNVVISSICTSIISDSVFLTIDTTSLKIITVPESKMVCEGDDVFLAVSASGTNLAYQWRIGNENISDCEVFYGSNTDTLYINNIQLQDWSMNYNVVVTGLCETKEISPNAAVFVNQRPQIYIATNAPICEGESLVLSANSDIIAAFMWTRDSVFVSGSPQHIIEEALESHSGKYNVMAVNMCTGCKSVDSIEVEVRICPQNSNDISPSEWFSPNNSGMNDFFVINGLEAYPENSIKIYNRWGNTIYKASPYENNWDGTANSGLRVGDDKLPEGTYYYVLNKGDGSPIIKGYVYLNR